MIATTTDWSTRQPRQGLRKVWITAGRRICVGWLDCFARLTNRYQNESLFGRKKRIYIELHWFRSTRQTNCRLFMSCGCIIYYPVLVVNISFQNTFLAGPLKTTVHNWNLCRKYCPFFTSTLLYPVYISLGDCISRSFGFCFLTLNITVTPASI